MTNEASKISIRAYAKHLGIDDKTVRKAIAKGQLKKGVSYVIKMQAGKEIEVPEIDIKIADKEWGDIHKTAKVKPGQKAITKLAVPDVEKIKKSPQDKGADRGADTPELSPEDEALISSMPITSEMPYTEITRRQELMELIITKMKLQEMEGILVRKEIVEKALFGLGVEFKKSLLNMPARITSDVRSASNDVEAQTIITTEIINILTQFSNLETLKL
jgi:uncharacterized sporulation protein YeaH/YhbH (DUF444 family)